MPDHTRHIQWPKQIMLRDGYYLNRSGRFSEDAVNYNVRLLLEEDDIAKVTIMQFYATELSVDVYVEYLEDANDKSSRQVLAETWIGPAEELLSGSDFGNWLLDALQAYGRIK